MMKINNHYDFVIVGSGFGGSVSALRLAEKGFSVLVIEKGKWYNDHDFPKTNWNFQKYFWVPGLKFFGIQKLSFFRHATVISGVGVGGGSLVYANTLPKPKTPFFNQGSWAGLSDWEKELEPHYETVWNMLGATENPCLGPSDLAIQKLASQIGKSESFAPTKVAVYFGDPDKKVPDPYFEGKGPEREGCNFCGACMTGCRHNAKNTLDKNYLHLAQQLGVTILAEHIVKSVIPHGEHGESGYTVEFKSSTSYFAETRSVQSSSIIFAGGVLGTIPLLLKLRKTTLPGLSSRVGEMIRTNNEALIYSVTTNPSLNLNEGIAIGSILELDEHSHLEPCRYGVGSGMWRLVMVPMVSNRNVFARLLRFFTLPFSAPIKWFKVLTVRDFARSSSVLLFMQHLDSTLKLRKGWFGTTSAIDKGKAPTPFIPEAHAIAHKFCEIIDGKPLTMITETLGGIPSTAHILGGACMGKNSDEGVIDKDNKVFGYTNMYVFDGSVISSNIGVNPALTIAAITELGITRIADKQQVV